MLSILALAAAQAAPQATPTAPAVQPSMVSVAPLVTPNGWNPAAEYITAGQDEPGYRSWYLAMPSRAGQVKAFNDYLATWQVSGIVPTWQLFRTATSWERCSGQPFEVPRTSEWPRIVQTLRYVHDYVVPTIGPVEAVSVYRNPVLNVCAGGAPESAHKYYSAIDMVPLKPTTREELMKTLCAMHGRRGPDYQVGLGFYAFLRFHVDTTKYRRWNMDPAVAAMCPPIVHQQDIATVAQSPQPAEMQPRSTPETQPPAAVPATEPTQQPPPPPH